jgi:two-component system, LytTR family, sensor kinase
MERTEAQMEDFGASVRRATFHLGILYWVAVFVFSSILFGFVGTDPMESAVGKLVHYSICSLITFGIAALLFRLHARTEARRYKSSLAIQAVLCFVLALLAAPIFCLIDFAIYMWCVWPHPAVFDWKDFGYNLIYGAALFFGWSCLFLTLLYSFEVRDRERRLAAIREEALAAQMRALRYQVNPHFLFNTLNSIAGLIEEGDAPRAERMVMSLSTFLRTTLSLDPMHDVPLADELALQEEYLEIERERFSDRMAFNIDMADDVRHALVPSLILQPLIENAIKHGVGATAGKVEIELRARREGGRLQVTVENDMPTDAPGTRPAGMGVGLRNVAERIRARFQSDGQFTFGPIAAGRFRASVDLPWRLA